MTALLSYAAAELRTLAGTNWGRLAGTVVLLLCCFFLLRTLRRSATAGSGTLSDRRERYVWLRNLVVIGSALGVTALWASSIAGVALSLAAVAGAILIVSKEMLTNILGHLYYLMTRPFKVGDFVDVAGIKGRLTDVQVLSLTLAETLEGHQLTGRTVNIPCSMLLTHPSRNLTATGAYCIQLLHIAVDPRSDILAAEQRLLDAAHAECDGWLEQANAHLLRFENARFVDLPSAAPRVLLELSDSKTALLALRYVCQPNERVKVEQAILRRYLKGGHAAPATPIA